MARQHPKKRYLFESRKSRPASNLPLEPLQEPVADTTSNAEMSGCASWWTLSRMKRFVHQFNHSQPRSVTPQVVGTSAVGGPREQQGQPQAAPCNDNQMASDRAEPGLHPGIDDAARAFDTINPMSHLGGCALNIVTDADTAFTDIQYSTDVYLKPFQVFNEVVTTLSRVHPYAQLALGILTAASQLLMKQANLDKAVFSLLKMIRGVYEFLAEEDTINTMNDMKGTLVKIARVISNSALFIKDYSKTKSFWKRTQKNIRSNTLAIVDDYITTLNDLMQQYRDHAARDIQINVHHVLEDLNLEGMAYAGGAGLDTTRMCLEGTRTEILRGRLEEESQPLRIQSLPGSRTQADLDPAFALRATGWPNVVKRSF